MSSLSQKPTLIECFEKTFCYADSLPSETLPLRGWRVEGKGGAERIKLLTSCIRLPPCKK